MLRKLLTHSKTLGGAYFDVLLTVHLSIILVLNQLNAQKTCFIISLLYASTCFEHYVLIIKRSKLYYTAYGIITPVDVMIPDAVHGKATYRCDDVRCYIIQF